MAGLIDSIEHERGRAESSPPTTDPHRPRYHFLPPANWMNDPNGFIQHKGIYHLFYQYNPAGAFHGTIHWGHAASVDLVHWQDRPVALAPTPGGPDSDGCWSGSAVSPGDGTADAAPLIFYSGVYPQTVCLAAGSDDLNTWDKHHANPIIAGPPPGFGGDTADFRDPYVWREGDTWYMVMGTRVENAGGAVLLYRSTDLMTWEYVGPLLVGDPTRREPFWTGTVWECPNLFALDDRHVLIVSFQDYTSADLLYVGAAVGDFDGERFTSESLQLLEYGDTLYAPQVTIDERGRRILVGWLREGRDVVTQRAAGWSGVMSLPRILTLGEDHTLRIRPVPELQQLRGQHHHLGEQIIRPGDDNPLDGVRSDCLEIAAALMPQEAITFGLCLRCSPDRAEQTTLLFDTAAGTIALDPSQSGEGISPNSSEWVRGAERAPLPAERPLQVRVFLDRSVIEVFVNDRVALSTRVYPTRPDSLGVEIFAEGGALRVESVDVWEMRTIWE